ncbi:MAG: hypothetical protein AMJ88_15640 [Anaerolineae bacterium SM23_ 63]|nr:MAG: hypothetical protein AMJ88_15640 [Anaerolineae bacterium SM23_ 63]
MGQHQEEGRYIALLGYRFEMVSTFTLSPQGRGDLHGADSIRIAKYCHRERSFDNPSASSGHGSGQAPGRSNLLNDKIASSH